MVSFLAVTIEHCKERPVRIPTKVCFHAKCVLVGLVRSCFGQSRNNGQNNNQNEQPREKNPAKRSYVPARRTIWIVATLTQVSVSNFVAPDAQQFRLFASFKPLQNFLVCEGVRRHGLSVAVGNNPLLGARHGTSHRFLFLSASALTRTPQSHSHNTHTQHNRDESAEPFNDIKFHSHNTRQ